MTAYVGKPDAFCFPGNLVAFKLPGEPVRDGYIVKHSAVYATIKDHDGNEVRVLRKYITGRGREADESDWRARVRLEDPETGSEFAIGPIFTIATGKKDAMEKILAASRKVFPGMPKRTVYAVKRATRSRSNG